MQVSTSEVYVQQISDLAKGLPEEKLRKVLAFVRKVGIAQELTVEWVSLGKVAAVTKGTELSRV